MNTEALRGLQNELRKAILEFDARCLWGSSKWCAELLNDIGHDLVANRGQPEEVPSSLPYPEFTSDILVAKAYFQMKEFLRCAHVIQDNNTPHGLFLKCYAKYIAGERSKQQRQVEAKDPLQVASVKNQYVTELLATMQSQYKADPTSLDGYCFFVFALLWRNVGNVEKARFFLIESIKSVPLNWSAWLTLAELITNKHELGEISDLLPKHWIKEFFQAHILTTWHDSESITKSHQILSYLAIKYQESSWVVAKTIRNQYQNRKFTDAQTLCEDLLKQDPYRLDDMDMYSHILYVKESKSELSRLAHRSVKIDKYRSETCSIIGNYYSLKGSHEKAILYFNRALKLQPNNLEALTLIGHEFVEMRNASAALQAYRRVINADPADYKAWYGLGQAYEILELPSFAIYYFRRACEIQPYDYRMWNAMAKCYEGLNLINDAIESYKKAEVNQDENGLSIFNLGRLYDKESKFKLAKKYYQKFVRLVQEHNNRSLREKEHYHTALLWLGNYFTIKKNYVQAEKYLRPLLDFQGNTKQKADDLLSKIISERGGTMNYGTPAPKGFNNSTF